VSSPEEDVYASATGSPRSASRHPLWRVLHDRAYRTHLLRHLLRQPDPLETSDRIVLERVIFRHYADAAEIRSVLFVGCDWYTRHYGRAYFRSKNYWTLDSDPRARKFGARRHLTAPLQALGAHLPPAYFDLIVCNGVFGYGLGSRQECELAFAACHRGLRPGGHLVLGWDDIAERTPVPLEDIHSLARFHKCPFGPLGTWRFLTDTPYRHTYDFYRVS